MVSAGNDGLFARLCQALDRPDLAQDERYTRNAGRVAHRVELLAALQDMMAQSTSPELMVLLDAHGIPNAPVQTVGAMASHPQLAATGILQSGPDDGLRSVGLPLSFDGERAAVQTAGAWPGRTQRHGAPGEAGHPRLRIGDPVGAAAAQAALTKKSSLTILATYL